MVIKDEILKALGATVQDDGFTYAKIDTITGDNKSVFIMAEHPIVALERLNELKRTILSGRPFIMLLLDIQEIVGKSLIDVSCDIIIGAVTNRSYSTDERYLNNFTPVLYPIYEAVMERLTNGSKTILQSSYIEHEKWDRVLWGKQGLYGVDANIFDDYIDAIEVNKINLKIKKSNC